ncbi:Small RNA 2'-O-methyltransferase [Grifola frondosa]|uniref:Small RNA 2'-O-methyltransferase n=1 Tax=Grifola frondosa TaxID=5627 RepID=A0A1C7M6I8_GRIFR|nr:Small RNA 2'-O-methyltransferase [Grifola frondosa]
MTPEVPEPNTQELTVTFQPPLSLDRQWWVLDVMRKENVVDLLDVGCGCGRLVHCLCFPTWRLSPPPPAEWPEVISFFKDCPPDPSTATIHTGKVYAVDISASDSKWLSESIRPSASDFPERLRWEPLEVKVWQGSLDSVNPEFVGFECICAMEVIEHLPEDVLADFAPIMLGIYHPRLLLITTPSYTYNARFTAPNAPPSARKGYLDPTGRTSRIFRHSDHKFEWTIEEFTEWCNTVADEWEYDVEVGGIGTACEKDPWGRELGYASQTAAFKRREGPQYAQRREKRCQDIGILDRASNRDRHELLKTHHEDPHEQAQSPKSITEIGELVKARMVEWREPKVKMHDLWFQNDIAIACGGWLELLPYAVHKQSALTLHKSSDRLDQWEAELDAALCPNPRRYWPLEDEVVDDEELSEISSVEESEGSETESPWGKPVDGWDETAWSASSNHVDWGTDVMSSWVIHDGGDERDDGWGTQGTHDDEGNIENDGQDTDLREGEALFDWTVKDTTNWDLEQYETNNADEIAE